MCPKGISAPEEVLWVSRMACVEEGYLRPVYRIHPGIHDSTWELPGTVQHATPSKVKRQEAEAVLDSTVFDKRMKETLFFWIPSLYAGCEPATKPATKGGPR